MTGLQGESGRDLLRRNPFTHVGAAPDLRPAPRLPRVTQRDKAPRPPDGNAAPGGVCPGAAWRGGGTPWAGPAVLSRPPQAHLHRGWAPPCKCQQPTPPHHLRCQVLLSRRAGLTPFLHPLVASSLRRRAKNQQRRAQKQDPAFPSCPAPATAVAPGAPPPTPWMHLHLQEEQ